MKFPKTYRQIAVVAKKHLLATVPSSHEHEAREQLFFINVSRFSIQSTVLVLMDTGLLLVYLATHGGQPVSGIFMGILIFKILLMAATSFLFARMSNMAYNAGSFVHRHVDLLYPLVHIIGEMALFMTGPQDLGSVLRLAALPFIAGGIPVINQVKSSVMMFALHLLILFGFTQSAYVSYINTWFSAFNFWAVVFACSIFVSFTVYSWYANNFRATLGTIEANEKQEALNAELSEEVRQRTNLLEAVNDICMKLLNYDADTFDDVMLHAMETIGTAIAVDRVYLWENHMEGEELYCTQVYEWSGGAEPQQDNELTVSVPFPSDWYPSLSSRKCVNGFVKEFPDYEREHLQAQGIVSILVVPVYIFDKFWGFVGLDDCHVERHFTEMEEAILRTVSLLFATSVTRNNMTMQLLEARDAALASSRAKTDFLANMSHEIRTPINAITGMSGMARQAAGQKEVHRCLDRIDTAVRQLLSIINDVLDMSKIEAGKIELSKVPFRMDQVLDNIHSIMDVQANEKELELAVVYDETLPEFFVGDDTRLTQVLINLLSNAVKFTPQGGKIVLGAKGGQTANDGSMELVFTVEDTGIGVTPEQKEHLFDKFEQADQGISRQYGGTGLGLPISKSIAELMGGGIEVTSVPGMGSRFTARVVLELGSSDMLEVSPVGEQETDFTGLCALLVEDIEINREIVNAMLEGTGLLIEEAADGQIAVDMIRSNPERYDIIFMDLHMPIKDGYTATAEIRAMEYSRAKQVPIIAMTANAFSEDIQRCLLSGMNDHVAKPVDFDELISKTAKHLL